MKRLRMGLVLALFVSLAGCSGPPEPRPNASLVLYTPSGPDTFIVRDQVVGSWLLGWHRTYTGAWGYHAITSDGNKISWSKETPHMVLHPEEER